MMFNLQLGTFVLILAQVNAEKAQNPEDGDRKARFIPHRASGIQIAKHQYCMQCIRGFVLHRDLLYVDILFLCAEFCKASFPPAKWPRQQGARFIAQPVNASWVSELRTNTALKGGMPM